MRTSTTLSAVSPLRVDLHLHTVASDGELTAEELVARCAAAGLGVIAVTDHNSLRSVPAAAAACRRHGLELVVGCEISTRWQGAEHHLLAYFVEVDDRVFAGRVEAVRAADLARCRRWVANAQDLGVPLTWEAVEALVGLDRVPPFAFVRRALLEAAADDPRFTPYRGERASHLWRDWFAPGRPLATEPPWQPDLVEALAWVREAGGVPVLAHPGATLRADDPEGALIELRRAGLAGVECWTTWHSAEVSARFDALARRLELAVTAGADFHGPTVKPFVHSPGQVEHNGADVLEALWRARERSR